MLKHFSKRFKTLRKGRDLTQDQVAEIFLVSPQSVSRWETAINFPDIEILPHIASFFNTTVDDLLGTEIVVGEQKAKDYLREIRLLQSTGKVSESIDLARQAVKEIPTNYPLQLQLMEALATAYHLHPDLQPALQQEIIATGERIIKYCTDPAIAPGAKYTLFKQYVHWGMTDDAQRLLDTMTAEVWQTQDVLQGDLLSGQAWLDNQRLRIIRFKNLLCEFLFHYAYHDTTTTLQLESLAATRTIEDTINTLLQEPPDIPHNAHTDLHLAQLHCQLGDHAQALALISKATVAAITHTGIIYQPDADGNNYMPQTTSRNLPHALWEDHLMLPVFDPIKTHPQFVENLKTLQEYSREV